jgi:hypothetical protein
MGGPSHSPAAAGEGVVRVPCASWPAQGCPEGTAPGGASAALNRTAPHGRAARRVVAGVQGGLPLSRTARSAPLSKLARIRYGAGHGRLGRHNHPGAQVGLAPTPGAAAYAMREAEEHGLTSPRIMNGGTRRTG